MRTKRSRAIIKILLYACFALCLLAGTEWYFRAKGYPVELPESKYVTKNPVFDKEKGWRYENRHCIYTIESPESDTQGHHALITIWPDGSRASYPAVRKPTDKHVLLLGCSYAFGQGVEDYETLAWYLNEYYPERTFENYANDAYGTYQCYLQEKQQLEQHQPGYYQLVLYCPIEHHLNRNLTYVLSDILKEWKDMPHENPPQQQQVFKAAFAPLWLCPSVYLNDDNTLGYVPAVKRWPGDEYSAVINLAKHFYYFRSMCKIVNKIESGDRAFLQYKRKIYRALLNQMNQCAHKHGANFATICLCDNSCVEMAPTEPAEFSWLFATYGTEEQPDSPKFRVGGRMDQHPNALVHQNWAKHIRTMINTFAL